MPPRGVHWILLPFLPDAAASRRQSAESKEAYGQKRNSGKCQMQGTKTVKTKCPYRFECMLLWRKVAHKASVPVNQKGARGRRCLNCLGPHNIQPKVNERKISPKTRASDTNTNEGIRQRRELRDSEPKYVSIVTIIIVISMKIRQESGWARFANETSPVPSRA